MWVNEWCARIALVVAPIQIRRATRALIMVLLRTWDYGRRALLRPSVVTFAGLLARPSIVRPFLVIIRIVVIRR